MIRLLAVLLASLAIGGCATSRDLPPLPLAEYVDLDRFMGRWYVIGHIPTFLDDDHINGVEHYARNPDDSIATTYTFQAGSVDAPRDTMSPTGFVRPDLHPGNAVWGMQFLWPIRADYRIAWLAPDYHAVIVAREARDHVWLMARTPDLPADELAALKQRIADMGHDMRAWRDMPQPGPYPPT
ncbi:MAG: lipocalin family protein [Chromatiales bacterium]|nr:lipocalin family protein [Gammaproteobacteria bacterium]MCP5351699.1 lipocalin family protein [Chromatiales bacterium]